MSNVLNELEEDTSGVLLTQESSSYRHAQNRVPYYSTENMFRDALRTKSIPATCDSEPNCTSDAVSPYRTYNGQCNNLVHPHWGQAGVPQKRLISRNRALLRCGRASGNIHLPNARLVSSIVIRRTETDTEKSLSMYLMLWGQLVDHDIVFTPIRMTRKGNFLDCCNKANPDSPICCPIFAPKQDAFYGRNGRPNCIGFIRSALVPNPGLNCHLRPDIENSNTAWLDASFVYGSTEERATGLRKLHAGQLGTSTDKRKRHFSPLIIDKGIRMAFGDSRGDIQTAFTMINTAFVRNHNKLASTLQQLHPEWDDEKLYQEARKINIAIVQHITYTQWVNALLGDPNNVAVPGSDGVFHDFYDNQVDPSVAVGFSTSAFRLHTFIGSQFLLADSKYKVIGHLNLRDVFNDPFSLFPNTTFDNLIRGLAIQPVRSFNNIISSDMTEFLFKMPKNNFGLDIVSINIQRGRDHMIPGYTRYRKFCGLGAADTWEQMEDLIPMRLVNLLRRVYQKPEHVDFYAGGSLEVPLQGSMIGPTAHCLVRDQLMRIRNGDRFFYTRPGMFTMQQLAAIRSSSLGQVLCNNGDEPSSIHLPLDLFRIATSTTGPNPIYRCKHLPKFDIGAWR